MFNRNKQEIIYLFSKVEIFIQKIKHVNVEILYARYLMKLLYYFYTEVYYFKTKKCIVLRLKETKIEEINFVKLI